MTRSQKAALIGLALFIIGAFFVTSTPTNNNGTSSDVANPAYEKVVSTSDGWVCTAGGQAADTHFARVRYGVEQWGRPFTQFYAKAVVVLPSDFYSKQKAGFRILATDNWRVPIAGVSYGAADGNDLRVGLSIYKDHMMYLLVDHYPGQKIVLWKSTSSLPTGRHIIELYGDVSKVAPWYLKIDGNTVAKGEARLSTDDTPVNERLITRFVSCIDGAADQDSNSMTMTLESFSVADYDPAGSQVPTATTFPSLTPTISIPTIVPTFTRIPVTTSPVAVPTVCDVATAVTKHFIFTIQGCTK